jgi:hypothetical protein
VAVDIRDRLRNLNENQFSEKTNDVLSAIAKAGQGLHDWNQGWIQPEIRPQMGLPSHGDHGVHVEKPRARRDPFERFVHPRDPQKWGRATQTYYTPKMGVQMGEQMPFPRGFFTY